MALSRALMIPTIGSSSELNGFVIIAILNHSLKTLNSSTIETTDIAALKAKHPCRWPRKLALLRSCHPQNLPCPKSTTFRMVQSPSSASSVVTGNSTSSENIFSFPKPLSIPTSELRLLLICTRFMCIVVMSWLPLFLINYQHGLLHDFSQGYLCIDTYRSQNWVTYVMIFGT